MRCRECNVDLPKEYTACPLCGGKVSEDKPLIEGIVLAEYPKVKTEPYKRNPFPVFLMIWALVSAVSFALYKTEILNVNVFSLLVSFVPMVWTLVFRPFLVKQLYVGNYVMMNLYPVALGGFLYCVIKDTLSFYFFSFLPVIFVIVLLALSVAIFFRPKVCKRAAPYAVLSGAVGVIAEIAAAITRYDLLNAWLIVVLICIVMLTVLFCKAPKETKEELKAKFSIQ